MVRRHSGKKRPNNWMSVSPLLDSRSPEAIDEPVSSEVANHRRQNREWYNKRASSTPGRTCWFPGCEALTEDDPTWRRCVGLCERCHRRLSSLVKGHGITVGQYRSLFMRQNRACGGCQREFAGNRKPFVDHCHDTGNVRGLLCHTCNSGLGMLGDNASGLRRLIRYLDRAQVIKSGKEPEWRLGRGPALPGVSTELPQRPRNQLGTHLF